MFTSSVHAGNLMEYLMKMWNALTSSKVTCCYSL